LQSNLIDVVAYDGGSTFPNSNGASISLNPDFLDADNNNGGNWCISTSTYGDGDLGTPGAANDACPDCMISNISIQNDACQEEDFVFEVAFDFAAGSGDYEVIRTDNNKILATGNTSPITVTLPNNRDNSDFEVIVRNVFDENCESEALLVDVRNCVDPCDIEIVTTRFTLPFCQGNNDGTITINATATLPLIYSIDGGTTFQNDPTFTNLEAGDYEIVVRTVGLDDCEERYIFNLMEGSPLELSRIIKADESCVGANDGRIEIYARLFVRDLLYSIDGGNTFQSDNIFTNLPAGGYEIVVKAVEEEACIENFGITTIEAGSDSEVPTFTCPDDLIIGSQPSRCGAVVQNIGLTNITDNCDPSPSITYSTSGALDNQIVAGDASGSIFPVGTTILTYFVEDEAGNIDSCKFSVTVEDNDAPIVQNCPSDIIIENATEFYRSGGIVTWIPPTFTDNCTNENDLVITNNIAPDFVPELGVTTITYTATDEAGNTSRCIFDIIVRDIYVTDPCVCLDNRTSDNNGQFAEILTVYSAPNETWRIVGVEGLFRAPSGAFPPVSGIQYELIPYQVG
ncbi:MAG: HYR domain-containing protein, partial [Bacteroidota bacterium]